MTPIKEEQVPAASNVIDLSKYLTHNIKSQKVGVKLYKLSQSGNVIAGQRRMDNDVNNMRTILNYTFTDVHRTPFQEREELYYDVNKVYHPEMIGGLINKE